MQTKEKVLMDDISPAIAQLWQDLAESSGPQAQKVLADIVLREQTNLADIFYRHMMEDPNAAVFLSVKAVHERLKPGLARWLVSLFCIETVGELAAVMAMQRHIGGIHARAEVPVNLVSRGMRLLKRHIGAFLKESDLDRDALVEAVFRTDRLIDIAFEEMSAAYVRSHETGARTDENYRLLAAGQNLSMEREKQMGALLDWENRLFRAVATENSLDQLSSLGNSAFGLWLHHKASLIFDQTRELPLMEDALRRVDDGVLAEFLLVSRRPVRGRDMRNLVRSVMAEMEQIKFMLTAMFERMTDLEVGRDVLTQLFNRRFLPTIMKREIELSRRKSMPFCVLMLDIDHFKQVNDQYGHDAGDRVLQSIASLLINQMRASDFVFRYGGEEFLVVLGEVDVSQAERVATLLRQRVEQTEVLLAANQSVKVTLSIGVAAFDGHPDYLRLVERADKALYAAKHGGRNQCVVSP